MKTLIELTGSFLILGSMWYTGNKSLIAPWLGIAGCVVLFSWFVYTHQWGLLPMEGAAIGLYARQAKKWSTG